MFYRTPPFRNACARAAAVVLCLFALAGSGAPARAQSSADPVYVFHTSLGNISVQLFPDVTPQTVANFLRYVRSGSYNSSFIHRSVSNFVIQGGGYTVDANANVSTIPANAPVVNEFHLSNTRGTISMAKVGSNPNSATDQWFFNEGDNSANLDNQNGGFTVFGRITDNASLAVMDAISSVPVYNEGSPFDQLPLVNYQSGAVVQSNFVQVYSIVPAWVAPSVAVGSDGVSRLLWDNADGRTAVWSIDGSNNVTSTPIFQPGSGWSARDISMDTQSSTHILWTNTDGRMTVWTVNRQGSVSSLPIYQPGGGWSAQAVSMDSNGSAHVLWFNQDGRMVVWTINSQGGVVSTPVYQPGGGWSAGSLSEDGNGNAHVLWVNTDGRMTVWTINSAGSVTSSPIYQPGGGWAARKVSMDNGGSAHVLWFNQDGRMTVWAITSAGSVTSTPVYQPGDGWSAQGLAMDTAGSARVLWANPDGRTTVWTINTQGGVVSTPVYQP